MTHLTRRNSTVALRGGALFVVLCVLLTAGDSIARAQESKTDNRNDLRTVQAFVNEFCVDCHMGDEPEGQFQLDGVNLNALEFETPGLDTTPLERILRRIDTRQMPPPTAERPSEQQFVATSQALTHVLDRRSKQFPNPGRVAVMRRLTRLEYQYSVRDLLGVKIDAKNYLPKDESSHGFDNITVEELSPTHLNRYLSAAQNIARAAIGGEGNGPVGVTIREPADRSQEKHVAGLPFGTRGGLVFEHHFHRTGDYEIELKLTRDRDEKIEGLDRKHEIDVLIDREKVHRFVVQPIKAKGDWGGNDYTNADAHLRTRIYVEAGTRRVGVTFPKTFSSLTEEKRQPFDANFNRHRHPRRTPAIFQVSLVGPFNAEGPGQTKSRQLVFGGLETATATRSDAVEVLRNLAQRAYRRPVDDQDLELLMQFFDQGFELDGFEQGIESALAAILVNPNFLFRVEGTPYLDASANEETDRGIRPIDDYHLATRLSYFIWSSLPDDRLLKLAAEQKLHAPKVIAAEVQRMLSDERSSALVDNFAAQWLYLRNLESITPDLRLFPDFDDNLRQAFAGETKHLFGDVLRHDRSVMDLLRTNVTFLNERLAKHYGIPGVRGSHFRAVNVAPETHRGGLLRHGSILMVTSYATRTSPTIRGNWILENIFGTPAPPPPPNVPNLTENTPLKTTSLRQRLAAHRANPACASCHDLMDPVGFALENFDAVGRWREFEGTLNIDSAGSLPSGMELMSVTDLENGIMQRPSVFATTLTEKLMTYALGRALTADDGPAVRRIVKRAKQDGYRLSSIITGIALSDPFRKRSE